jgi:sugar lactone lactonase YvrE
MTAIDMPVENVAVRVLGEARCHLGEGPAYDAGSDTAWWFDILEKRLHEMRLADGAVHIHTLPFMASALAFVDDTRQLVAGDDGLYVRTLRDGRLTLAVPLEADNPSTRSNDGRAHPSGAFWIGTMGRQAEAGAGAIYAFRAGEIRALFAGITIPNAICFSPDGATGYFTDTRANVLCRVALDPATGLPTGAPQTLHVHGGPGGLDGAGVDAEGRIWCAIWGGACLHLYSPEGALVRRVAVPARQPSCPVFVGADFRRVLVTSAYEGMDETARAADAHHGRTFLLDVGATGRPEPRVGLGSA